MNGSIKHNVTKKEKKERIKEKQNLAKTLLLLPVGKFLLVAVDGSAKLGAFVGQILAGNVEGPLLALNRLPELVIGNSGEVVLIGGRHDGGGRHDVVLARRRVALELPAPVNGERTLWFLLPLLLLFLHRAFERRVSGKCWFLRCL